jgi:S-adenosylmethionine:tRNA ribosyltransferase-isomerase
MKITDFDYILPETLIANKPKEKRDESNLLILNRKNKSFKISKFKNIGDYINPGDLIVINDTKVIPARLIGYKPTGGKIELLLLNNIEKNKWETLVKPGKRFKEGAKIYFNNDNKVSYFKGSVEKVLDDGKRIIKFECKGDFYKLLLKYGAMPLPPYIKNTPLSEKEIRKKYQTIYAKNLGAAAAPTAGLHFTKELIKKLKNKGVQFGYLTLHVNAGTFLPVKEDNIKNHKMYKEYYKLPRKLVSQIKNTKEKGKKIIVCGTTTLRALETIFKDGMKINKKAVLEGNTDIFIYPGYKFKIVDSLITNFHLPRSTLLLLVCAFASRKMILNAYEEAKKNNFRFFSFGDAMLIL